MKYKLDISNVKNTGLSYRALNFRIPLKTGEHQLQFDLIECDIPKDIYQELIAKIKGNGGDVEAMPVGIDYMPIGAKLIRIS